MGALAVNKLTTYHPSSLTPIGYPLENVGNKFDEIYESTTVKSMAMMKMHTNSMYQPTQQKCG